MLHLSGYCFDKGLLCHCLEMQVDRQLVCPHVILCSAFLATALIELALPLSLNFPCEAINVVVGYSHHPNKYSL